MNNELLSINQAAVRGRTFNEYRHSRKPSTVSRKTMSITLVYEPDKGILYNGNFIAWGTSREATQAKLQGHCESKDLEFEGVVSRRDIYSKLDGRPVSLFLNFDSNDQFFELEIHNGVELKVADRRLSFNMQFSVVVDMLDEISFAQKVVNEGEILFIDLKLSLCSQASMGGDQNDSRVSYIYCGQDISHLLE